LKSASLCDYYFEVAEQVLKEEYQRLASGSNIKIENIPLGTVLGVFPWNFPFWQILRSAIPTAVSGNAMLIKPAPNVGLCSKALQELINESGIPTGILKVALLNNEQIESCIASNYIHAVTFTGSTKTGAYLASLAGKHLKPIVLELGGSDPLILLDDVNLPEVMDEILFSRFQNNGQSCVAAKRFLVQTEMKEEFLALAKQKIATMNLGNPLDEDVKIGPLARKDLAENLVTQLKTSLDAGANLYWQQEQIPEQGYFFAPCILTDIPADNLAAQEELFGPILSVFTYQNELELISIANQTEYGLGASIFTQNIERAKRIAEQIESGMVYINQMVKSDPSIPFGGIKKSGFGRELGAAGLLAFCQQKTTWVKLS
ncbi:MAG: aldehyde dehydrogenase family protein, partial [Bacteroidia bacterium]|nr:aldehyde dehydrogenase family protein [Bacteroidia bacterium]